MGLRLPSVLAWDRPIGPGAYFLSGVSLVAVKYGLDVAMARLFDRDWSPINYIVPSVMGIALSPPEDQAFFGAMVLIAAAFTMQHVRGRKTGGAVLLAFGAGIGLFFLRNLAQVLGDNGQVPPLLAGWTPPLVGGLLALALILAREDG